ncbi:MAG: leucine-rich repeat protein [Ruminococcus sp.]|nr:leucine-rich repeat protein [Ruminococcus sp.]MDD5889045.1 leucine-rich repeat protein [Ruminococcus sp.]
MRKLSKLSAVILTITIAFCMTTVNPIFVNAVNTTIEQVGSCGGVQEKLNSIASVYPTGSYFTASGNVCYSNQSSDCQLSNIPSRGGLPSGATAANVTRDAWSCCAFARYVFYCTFGLAPESCGTVSSSNAQIGDYMNLGSHYAIYLGQDSTYWYVYDSNYTSPATNVVKYNRALRKSNFSSVQIHHASNYDTINNSGNNPTGFVDGITGSTNAINVRGWVFDKDDISKSLDIHVYIGGPAGSGAEGHSIVADQYRPDVNSIYGVGDYHGFSSTIYTNLSGNQEVFIYGINTMGGSNVLLDSQTVYIDRDLYKPVIQKIYITDVTPYAFTVNAVISDDRGVSEVKFPTWKDGSPDVKWYIPKCVDTNTYSYRVHINDLTNEPGVYHTHVYAYDVGRNESVDSIDIIVPDKGLLIYEIVNGNIHIQGANDKTVTEISIPSTIDNKTVTEISDNAFLEFTNLSEITLPDTITRIGNNAFAECWHLKELTCPSNLLNIGNSAFSSCYGLNKISFNDKLQSIGNKAFYTTNLSVVYLPASLSFIGEYSLGYKYDDNLLPQKRDLIIFGQSKSNSEIYAKNNGIDFIPIDHIGDVNSDGVISIADATTLQKYLANIVDFDDEQLAVADTNGDGSVSIADATQIQKYLANIISSLG